MDDVLTGFLAGQADSNNNGGNGGMFGGDWAGIWGIIILAMVFGWGGFGGMGGMGGMGNMMWPLMFGGFGGGSASAQGALTREQACIDQNFNNLGRTVEGIASAVNAGFQTLDTRVCQQSYETAQQINGVNNTIMEGFNAANVVALQNANAANIVAMQNQNALSAQLAQCLKKISLALLRIFFTDNFYAVGTCAA